MKDSCPVLTPAERQYLEIQDRVQQAMLVTIYKAIDDATAQAAAELKSTEWQQEPPPRDYFAATAHQRLFVLLCGGDTETYEGGNPQLAAHILQNGQNISDHYWGKRNAGNP
ncbi:hypothetical protein EV217_4604 [Phyllobacterium myrsinacearum]|uniref:hypothetical protein n=1 Tax=Phyllobacterium myrsinacearum TaxID=28101 RepID=UPI00102909DC|nr:hypothetical protein [Phyllobacterium myrsinacearum]RZS77246.1 hypothetical protein EV217_4604 [Phyllobacterium myrsinacearum]